MREVTWLTQDPKILSGRAVMTVRGCSQRGAALPTLVSRVLRRSLEGDTLGGLAWLGILECVSGGAAP